MHSVKRLVTSGDGHTTMGDLVRRASRRGSRG
jgi:hypothetical protein